MGLIEDIGESQVVDRIVLARSIRTLAECLDDLREHLGLPRESAERVRTNIRETVEAVEQSTSGF